MIRPWHLPERTTHRLALVLENDKWHRVQQRVPSIERNGGVRQPSVYEVSVSGPYPQAGFRSRILYLLPKLSTAS